MCVSHDNVRSQLHTDLASSSSVSILSTSGRGSSFEYDFHAYRVGPWALRCQPSGFGSSSCQTCDALAHALLSQPHRSRRVVPNTWEKSWKEESGPLHQSLPAEPASAPATVKITGECEC